MERLGFSLAAAVVLAGCITTDGDRTPLVATAPSTGRWEIRQEVSRISGTTITIAQLHSTSARQQSRKKSFLAKISIFCESGRPVIYITFEGTVSSRVKTDFAYRADTIATHVPKAGTSSDRKSVVLRQDESGPEFLRLVGPSSMLFVRIDSPGTGISEAEFATNGAAAAIETALRDCPLPDRRESPRA